MLPICLVKLISILLNYKVKDNSVQWIELPRDVRGKATNKLYFFGKKRKRKNPADIMLNTACVDSFCLSPCMKLKCRQKFWLEVQFCCLLQDLQLQYFQILSMLISGGNFIKNNFILFCIGARHPYKFSKDWSPRDSQQILYREAPPQGPTP